MMLGEGEGGDCVLLNDVMYQSQFVSFGPPNYVRMCMLQCTTSLLCGTK